MNKLVSSLVIGSMLLVATPVFASTPHVTVHKNNEHGNCVDVSIALSALPAHLASGWQLGGCPEPTPTPTPTVEPTDEPTPTPTPTDTPVVMGNDQGGTDQGPGGDCEKSTDPGACGADHSNTIWAFHHWIPFVLTCRPNDGHNWLGFWFCDLKF